MKSTAALFDMDGSLCDVSEIRFHVNPKDPHFSGTKRFDRFHADSIDCPPNQSAMREYWAARDAGHAIIIVTARKFQWRYHTMLWLKENDVAYHELFMRGDDDNRADYDVKADILAQIQEHYEPVLAVDDNPAVIEVWREHGIPTVRIPGWTD